MGESSLLHTLNATDSMLISFAVRKMTNKEIASILHLSVNTVSRKYTALPEKTDTHTKQEPEDR